MQAYYAFLRGINVGGKNIIPMTDLSNTFENLGCKNVRTWIQSGNVRFETGENSIEIIKRSLERSLLKRFCYPGPVILRREEEVFLMVKSDPFRDVPAGRTVKLYVCFLESMPEKAPELPLINEKEGLEIFLLNCLDLFVISRELQNGRYGFPNNFVEKELGVNSTARNWNTIQKMVKL